MRVLRSIPELAELAGPVCLSIGVFDGVHLGHRAVIGSAIAAAKKLGGSAVAVTFDPHPARVLRPNGAPHLLTSTPHKIRLIGGLDVAALLVVNFDEVFAASPPEEFIAALAGACRPIGGICVGPNWAFGRKRSGNIDLLRREGDRLGFAVTEHAAVEVHGQTVSSTRIRTAIQAGNFSEARDCLGRDYAILGTVEHGRHLGRTIGFPTANLRAHNEQFPPDGVYAVVGSGAGLQLRGVANIGVRPTIQGGDPERVLEAHFFDMDRDLYGEDIELVFAEFIRPEKTFSGIDALRAQIALDADQARQILNALPTGI